MFYNQFLDLCKQKDISPAAVARALGLSNSTTTAWKRGSIPKGDTLQKLADYFEVSTDYLLGKEVASDALRFGIVSVEDIANEMNAPVELVWDAIHSPNNVSPKTREKVFAVAALLATILEGKENTVTKGNLRAISYSLNMLNVSGQQEAVKRVEELTEIRRYQRAVPPQEAPQPPAEASGDTDTPALQNAPEGPQKGE